MDAGETVRDVPTKRFPWAALGLGLTLLAGLTLRVGWMADMEYKGDELWTFQRTQNVGVSEPWPWLGMPTSFYLRHPGGTVWVFLGLGWLFDVRDPVALGRACALLNFAAIALVVVLARRWVPAAEREPWLWAAALACVNPLAVLLHRKIWPPSVAPLFAVLFLAAWWARGRRGGAFAWGLAGLALGQVHPAGLFMAAGFTLWAALFDRRATRWRWWALGSAVGALPLLPWLIYAMNQQTISLRRWTNLVEFKFWTRWALEPFGVSLQYSLGDDFADFLRYPLWGDQPTYLVAALHAVGLAVAVGVVWLALRHARRSWAALAGLGSPTALTLAAGFWGFGLVFTLTGLPIFRHYMVLTFPLMYLWAARLALGCRPATGDGRARPGRALLATLVVSQGLISFAFLAYIHANPRPIRGDYGTPYSAQAHAARQP